MSFGILLEVVLTQLSRMLTKQQLPSGGFCMGWSDLNKLMFSIKVSLELESILVQKLYLQVLKLVCNL